jgi:quercetin dioxygenase-like cupin family protein
MSRRTDARSTVRSFIRALPILPIVGVAGCASLDAYSPPMAAASGVARADAGKGPREYRIIPLKSMAGDVEILYGDPEVAGEPFVMRIRELPGTIVPPHSHPVDEHITVVQGTWYFALGNEYKAESLQELKAGSYAFAPKGSTMFGFSPAGAIVQVHGVGPFRIHWLGGLHTLDDPDAKSVFRFARGARVLFKTQNGKVAEGYASGKVVQYEIEAPNGERFMASEHELQPQ